MYKIEKGIPISGMYGKWKAIVRPLEPGDSILIPEEDYPEKGKDAMRGSLLFAAKSLGYKLATRTVEGGLRIWRTS